MSRSAIAVLSTANLLHNLEVLKNKVPHAKIIAMIKANAYGHGLRSVALRLANSVAMFGVASIDEALALRKVGVTIPIMLAEGVFEASELIVAAAEGFHVVFHEHTQLRWLEKTYCALPIHTWLKVDTGMGRLGFHQDEAYQVYQTLNKHTQVAKPVRLLSHFSCADQKNHFLNEQQIKKFDTLYKEFKTEGSLCNSAGIFHFHDRQYDFVRPGIALYGASPSQDTTALALGLKPVMTLQTNLIAIRQMNKGATIGYGARYTCPQDMPLGVISFGYGDGYPRTARDGTPLLIGRTRCPMVGRVSMDMITVDLRGCPTAQVGDPVILWGEGLPVEEVAAYTNHIAYDLLTGVQNRVKFYWTPSN